MQINRLSGCKTLEDFNEFATHLKVDGKSTGRSFVYVDKKGRNTRSYTMNQIVRQFDQCIQKSKKTANKDLSKEVNEGLDFIDRCNNEANQAKHSSSLSTRQKLGNRWYGLTHRGADKEAILEKIREVYPKVAVNLPQILPQDVLNLVISNLDNDRDIAAMSLVNKASYQKIQKLEAENDRIIAKYGIIGKKQWHALLGVTIGDVPPLPEGIEEMMESDCPVWKGKKIRETHMLVLIPETVNGKPLTIGRFAKLYGKKISSYAHLGYIHYKASVLRAGKSHWVLMTKANLPGSEGQSFATQKALVNSLSENPLTPYEVPDPLEAVICYPMNYLRNKRRYLYGYTACEGGKFLFGNFGSMELSTHDQHRSMFPIGVAARRVL